MFSLLNRIDELPLDSEVFEFKPWVKLATSDPATAANSAKSSTVGNTYYLNKNTYSRSYSIDRQLQQSRHSLAFSLLFLSAHPWHTSLSPTLAQFWEQAKAFQSAVRESSIDSKYSLSSLLGSFRELYFLDKKVPDSYTSHVYRHSVGYHYGPSPERVEKITINPDSFLEDVRYINSRKDSSNPVVIVQSNPDKLPSNRFPVFLRLMSKQHDDELVHEINHVKNNMKDIRKEYKNFKRKDPDFPSFETLNPHSRVNNIWNNEYDEIYRN